MGEWNGTIFKPDADNETIFSLFEENFQVENIEAWMDHFKKLEYHL